MLSIPGWVEHRYAKHLFRALLQLASLLLACLTIGWRLGLGVGWWPKVVSWSLHGAGPQIPQPSTLCGFHLMQQALRLAPYHHVLHLSQPTLAAMPAELASPLLKTSHSLAATSFWALILQIRWGASHYSHRWSLVIARLNSRPAAIVTHSIFELAFLRQQRIHDLHSSHLLVSQPSILLGSNEALLSPWQVPCSFGWYVPFTQFHLHQDRGRLSRLQRHLRPQGCRLCFLGGVQYLKRSFLWLITNSNQKCPRC